MNVLVVFEIFCLSWRAHENQQCSRQRAPLTFQDFECPFNSLRDDFDDAAAIVLAGFIENENVDANPEGPTAMNFHSRMHEARPNIKGLHDACHSLHVQCQLTNMNMSSTSAADVAAAALNAASLGSANFPSLGPFHPR